MVTTMSFVHSIFKSFWARLGDTKLHHPVELDFSCPPTSIDLRKLATPSDTAYLPTIKYAYDPLPALAFPFDQRICQLPSGTMGKNSFLSLNSVQLDPLSAGLPYRCSIDHVRASKFWESILGETVKLLNLIALDNSTSDIEVDHGITVGKLARKALRPGLEHQMVLATNYMFPGADEQRIKQISALMIIYFVFDGAFSTSSPSLRPLNHVCRQS